MLRDQEMHLTLFRIPSVMIVISAIYSLASYPAGLLGSRFGKLAVLGASIIALIAAQVASAWVPGAPGFWIGVSLWGLRMGLSQGGLLAAVAELAPPDMRATCFGIF